MGIRACEAPGKAQPRATQLSPFACFGPVKEGAIHGLQGWLISSWDSSITDERGSLMGFKGG
jgi:hypothetical protein